MSVTRLRTLKSDIFKRKLKPGCPKNRLSYKKKMNKKYQGITTNI